MSAPDRIFDVYDAPRHLGGKLLGEIREQWLTLYAFTRDGREIGKFVKLADAAVAIDRAMREPVAFQTGTQNGRRRRAAA